MVFIAAAALMASWFISNAQLTKALMTSWRLFDTGQKSSLFCANAFDLGDADAAGVLETPNMPGVSYTLLSVKQPCLPGRSDYAAPGANRTNALCTLIDQLQIDGSGERCLAN